MNLKTLRRARGLTQRDLAEALGVTCQSISAMENTGEMRIKNAIAPAEILEVDLNTLLVGELACPKGGMPCSLYPRSLLHRKWHKSINKPTAATEDVALAHK